MTKSWGSRAWILNSTLACTVFWGTLGLLLLQSPLPKSGTSEGQTADWPVQSLLHRDQGHPSLLIFLDPTCPTSQASLLELAKVMARWRGRLTARAILNLPDQRIEGIPQSEAGLEQDLTDLPDVAFCYDPGGKEARRFGVSSPGQVVLFDTQGHRQCSRSINSSPVDGERLSEEIAKLILKVNPNRGFSDRSRNPDDTSSNLSLRSEERDFE